MGLILGPLKTEQPTLDNSYIIVCFKLLIRSIIKWDLTLLYASSVK